MTEIYQALVEHFGSQSKTARELGVKQPSVKAWLIGKTKMGAISARRAEIITEGKFKASDLCPKLKELENL